MTADQMPELKPCNNGFCLNGGSSNAQCRECCERSNTIEGTVQNALMRMKAERQDKGWIYEWLLDAWNTRATPPKSQGVEEAIAWAKNEILASREKANDCRLPDHIAKLSLIYAQRLESLISATRQHPTPAQHSEHKMTNPKDEADQMPDEIWYSQKTVENNGKQYTIHFVSLTETDENKTRYHIAEGFEKYLADRVDARLADRPTPAQAQGERVTVEELADKVRRVFSMWSDKDGEDSHDYVILKQCLEWATANGYTIIKRTE